MNTEHKPTAVGGQALIEGLMMRSADKIAMAVRNSDGEIILEKHQVKMPKKWVTKTPLIRGMVMLFASLKVGYKCLMRSAEIAGLDAIEQIDEEEATKELSEKQSKRQSKKEAKLAIKQAKKEEKAAKSQCADNTSNTNEKSNNVLMGIVTVVAGILGVVLALVLFMWLPEFLFSIASRLLSLDSAMSGYSLLQSASVGVIRIILFVSYMGATSLMKDIRRTYMYHGAEHKAIYCHEQNLPLTLENVKAQSRFHPRCGTSFLIFMLIIGIFIGLLIPSDWNTLARTGTRFLLLPFIVGIGYEFIRFAGKKRGNKFVRLLSAPGIWLQKISTREPDDAMIECAIVALESVLAQDEINTSE